MGNVALNKAATASSSVVPFTAGRAVDGSAAPTSRWLCNPVPCWMSVDLGTTYWINRWVLRHMGTAGWPSPYYNMSDFKFQGSNDNRTWYDIDSVVGNTVSVTDRQFTARQFRYVRVYVTKGLNINSLAASIVGLEVYDAPPSSQYLSNLTISSGTLSPNFSKNTYTYTASVSYGTSSITVTPTGEDSYSIITVNGVAVQSGHQSQAINLSLGSNTINVEVTAGIGGAKQTYTINMTRLGSPYLSSLTLANIPLSFAKNTYSYSVDAGYDITTTSVTAVPEDSTATMVITANGATVGNGQDFNLNIGSNTITVDVTGGGGSQRYTVTVTRASNPYLKSVSMTGLRLPAFVKTQYSYTINNVTASSTVVTAVAEDTAASVVISLNNINYSSGQTVPLSLGNNAINIQVTSAIGADTRTYVYNVNKTS